jgi:hypothetical protein
LLNKEDVCIKEGYLSTLEVGEVLYIHALQELKQ